MSSSLHLRAYRLARGLSQNDVARILGLADSSFISRWENGFSLPNLLNAFRLAQIYGTTVDALFPELREKVQHLGSDQNMVK
jgi:transcriptional regulator with XRE-family HTH domain